MPARLKSEVLGAKIVTNGTLVLRIPALLSAPLSVPLSALLSALLSRGTNATREQVLV